MYRVLFFTDYHISSKGRRTMRRLDETMRTANWIADQVKEHWPDAVVNLGDTFDNHSSLDVPSLCTGVRAMDIIMQACNSVQARFITIPGNHDAYSFDYSSLEAFTGLGMDVVWKPIIYDDVLGVLPFTKNADLATKWIQELEDKCLVVGAHIDVKHAKYFSGGPDSDIGVDPDDFRGVIYAGHYHHPHNLGAFRFIGSVLHHNFSDHALPERRGLMVVDVDEDGSVTENKIANPHTAVYHKLDWSKKKAKLDTIRLYGTFAGRMHLRIKCDVKEAKQVKSDAAEMFPDLLSLAVIGIDNQNTEVKRDNNIRVDADPEDALETYIKNKGVPDWMDEEELLKLGKGFLKEATC